MERNKILLILFVTLFVTSFVTGCVTTPQTGGGVYHIVKKGETLWRIARAYNTTPDELSTANNLPDTTIEAGGVLFIPHATKSIDIAPEAPSVAPDEPVEIKKHIVHEEDLGPTRGEKSPAPIATQGKTTGAPIPSPRGKIAPPAAASGKSATKSSPQPKTARARFIWPVDGSLSSRFGTYKGIRHNGIKIAASEGTPVRSAAKGTVTFAAPMKYFGETVIIKHNDIYSTVYSHLKKRTVRPGTTVKQGDKIGLLGKGEDGTACLYFEMRRNNRASDPLRYLPKKE